MEVRTAEEAATALVRAFGLRYGELSIRVAEGAITVIRHGNTLKLEDLAAMPLDEGPVPT